MKLGIYLFVNEAKVCGGDPKYFINTLMSQMYETKIQ